MHQYTASPAFVQKLHFYLQILEISLVIVNTLLPFSETPAAVVFCYRGNANTHSCVTRL